MSDSAPWYYRLLVLLALPVILPVLLFAWLLFLALLPFLLVYRWNYGQRALRRRQVDDVSA